MTITGEDAKHAPGSGLSNLADTLGLTAEESLALRAAFGQALSQFGLDGPSVLAKLDAGGSASDALSLPACLGDLLYARAYNWFNIGRFDKAQALFRALCVLDGRSLDNWLGYGICLKILGHPDASEMVLRIAAQVDPKSALPHYHLLDLAMRRAAWEPAAAHLATYDGYDDANLPPSVKAEVEKYRSALIQRSSSSMQVDGS